MGGFRSLWGVPALQRHYRMIFWVNRLPLSCTSAMVCFHRPKRWDYLIQNLLYRALKNTGGSYGTSTVKWWSNAFVKRWQDCKGSWTKSVWADSQHCHHHDSTLLLGGQNRQRTEVEMTLVSKTTWSGFVRFLHLLRGTTRKPPCKCDVLIRKNCLSLNNSMGESTTFRIRLHSVHNLEFQKLYIQAMFINPFQRKWVIGH